MERPGGNLRSDLKPFSGSSQLAGMVLAEQAPRRVLVAFPPEPGLPRVLARHLPHPTFLYLDYAVYRRDLADDPEAAPRLHFSLDPVGDDGLRFDLALLYLPKGRELIEHAFAIVGRCLEAGGIALVVGPKKSGIRSSKRLAERYLGEVRSTRAARHAQLHTVRRTVERPPAFDGEKRYRVEAWGERVEVVTLPGVFSHGRLDDGTRYLLDHFQPGAYASALDFGCGAGVLGALLARLRPQARVDLVDSHLMALEASRRTLRANRLDDSRVSASDVLSAVDGRYDLILSNPPFHQGLATDFAATNELIGSAGRHLTDGGRLVLVANSFIDYLTPLDRSFCQVTTLSRSPRYRILEATRPR